MSQEDLPRFFALPINPPAVELPAAEAHHALNVLRLRAGMEVEVFDGQGAHAVGRISHARHGQVTVTVLRVDPPTCRPEPVVHLAFAVPKGKRLDWLLEKATELGAASLQPVVFQRSVAGGEELSEGKRDRWLTHCIAAAKQCGLDFLPAIRDTINVVELCKSSAVPAGEDQVLQLLGDIEPDAVPFAAALADVPPGAEVRLLVGPEGGVTPQERALALAAGFRPVRLGSTTLRVETAALALLAATVGMYR